MVEQGLAGRLVIHSLVAGGHLDRCGRRNAYDLSSVLRYRTCMSALQDRPPTGPSPFPTSPLVQMAVALGGRIAEELIFGEDDITTGASGDFQQVTRIARLMVTQLGLSKRLGQVAWSSSGGAQFLGAQAAQPADFSQATADEIDNEVGRISPHF